MVAYDWSGSCGVSCCVSTKNRQFVHLVGCKRLTCSTEGSCKKRRESTELIHTRIATWWWQLLCYWAISIAWFLWMGVLGCLNDNLELLPMSLTSVSVSMCVVRLWFITVQLAGGILLSCDKTNLFTFWGKVRSHETGREAKVDWERERL